jgi:hypothetical protein
VSYSKPPKMNNLTSLLSESGKTMNAGKATACRSMFLSKVHTLFS